MCQSLACPKESNISTSSVSTQGKSSVLNTTYMSRSLSWIPFGRRGRIFSGASSGQLRREPRCHSKGSSTALACLAPWLGGCGSGHSTEFRDPTGHGRIGSYSCPDPTPRTAIWLCCHRTYWHRRGGPSSPSCSVALALWRAREGGSSGRCLCATWTCEIQESSWSCRRSCRERSGSQGTPEIICD